MLAKWIGDVVGKMHRAGITMKVLAGELGWHEKYLSAVLNGHRAPKDAEQKIKDALAACIKNTKKAVQ